MEIGIKDSGLKIIVKDKVLWNILMVISMRGIGKKVKEKVLEFKDLVMVKFIKDHGLMIKWMVKEYSQKLIQLNSKGSLKIIR